MPASHSTIIPFLGALNNETAITEGIDDSVTVHCPECNNPIAPGGSHRIGKVRHVYLTLEIRPESADDFGEVRKQTHEFHSDGSMQIGEFEEAGTYHLIAERDGEQYQETAAVLMRDLADCNYPTLEIHLHDSEVTIGYSRTDTGCRPATVSPTSESCIP